jgi:HlyD family secretion protein
MRKRTKRILIGLALGAALLGGCIAISGGEAATGPLPTATAQRRDLASRATATGNVASPAQLNLGFPGGGRLTEVLVKPGDSVVAGQPLARVDPGAAQLALESATAEVRAAEARLVAAQAGRPQAQADLDAATVAQSQAQVGTAGTALDNARAAAATNEAAAVATLGAARRGVERATAERDAATRALDAAAPEDKPAAQERVTAAASALAQAQDGVVTAESGLAQARQQGAQAIADAEGGVANARAAVTVAEAQASANNVGPAAGAVAEAQAAVDRAKVAVAQTQRDLDQTVLVAPAAGVVAAVNGRAGEVLPAGGGIGEKAAAFLTLLVSGPLEVRANFVEADAARLQPGQVAKITLDAVPGTELQARVVTVDPSATVVNNVVNYGVRFEVTGTPPATVRPGMTAAIDVVVESRPKVLVVPAAAVSQLDGQAVVQVRGSGDGAKPVARPVELGGRGDGFIEIRSGLDEGTTVVLPDEEAKP